MATLVKKTSSNQVPKCRAHGRENGHDQEGHGTGNGNFAALAYKEAKNAFVMPGIGKLVLVNRKARMGRNPQTGEAIKISAKRVVKFRVAKAAKYVILGEK